MTADLILVRHAAPEIDPAVPAPEWRLSGEGRAAAARLSTALLPYAPIAALATSPEPKARETAEILGAHLGGAPIVDEDLAEHRRPGTPFGSRETFEARMSAFLSGDLGAFPGGESLDAAAARFEASLERYRARPLLITSHGTITTLYLARRLSVDPFQLWRSLLLPEAFVLDHAGQLLRRISAAAPVD